MLDSATMENSKNISAMMGKSSSSFNGSVAVSANKVVASEKSNSSAPPAPIAIPQSDIKKETTANKTTTHKTLTARIFNWLKRPTDDNKCDENRFTAPPLWMRPRDTAPDVTSLDNYRGVQNLRHLWNDRISACAESVRQSSTRLNKRKLTKSINCLVSEGNNNFYNSQANLTEGSNDILPARFNRAQSLYDCRPFGLDGELLNDKRDNINGNVCEIDSLHRLKDNFYKYKTAEQASEALARARLEASTTITSCHNCNNNFPGHIQWLKRNNINIARRTIENAEETQENSEKYSTSNHIKKQGPDTLTVMAVKDKESATTTSSLVDMNADISECCNSIQDNIDSGSQTLAREVLGDQNVNNNNPSTSPSTSPSPSRTNSNQTTNTTEEVMANDAIESKDHNGNVASLSRTSSSDTGALTAINNSQRFSSTAVISELKSVIRSVQRENALNKCSGTSSPTPGGSRKNIPRRTPSNTSISASGVRKYSFKTHSRTVVVPRKMSTTSGSSGNVTNSPNISSTGSVVARLTQQFNELYLKDKSVLMEVKRKNGVLLTRGGHVYKIIGRNDSYHQVRRHSSNASPSISRTSSRGSKDLTPTCETPYGSVVQKTIEKFELVSEKPQVPPKSKNVCVNKLNLPQTLNGSTIQNNNNNDCDGTCESDTSERSGSKRSGLTLPLVSVHENVNTTTSQATVSAKKQSHTILLSPPTLEVVKEEARTPLESDEKKIGSGSKQNVCNTDILMETENIKLPETVSKSNSYADVKELKQELQSQKPYTDSKAVSPRSPKDNLVENVTRNSSIKIESCIKMETPKNSANGEENLPSPETDTKSISSKQRYKKKCAKIYEKFRFFSPFESHHANSSKVQSTSPTNTTTTTTVSSPAVTPPLFSLRENDNAYAACKLIDALEVCTEKINSISESSRTTAHSTFAKTVDSVPVAIVCKNDDFEKVVLPNTSFIHKKSLKQAYSNQLLLTQAVNVTLVNSIEGKQMITDQKELQTQLLTGKELKVMAEEKSYEPNTIEEENSTDIDEAIYESIKAELDKINKPYPYKRQQRRLAQEAKRNQKISSSPLPAPATEAEPLKLLSTENSVVASLNDYESIAGSNEHGTQELQISITTTDSSTPIKPAEQIDDGYEICEPPPPSEPVMSPSSIAMVRNTNDELPELPKPKRRLPKSPMPKKRTAKATATTPKTTAATVVPNDPAPVVNVLSQAHEIEDHHYYADDENIYDTIKSGSHCYESLHANNSRLQKTPSMASSVGKPAFESIVPADSLSLTSNCYESISQYRRIIVSNSGAQANGSSSGSTLTISSDHKTNSLYEAPLAAGILYPNSVNRNIILCAGTSSPDGTEDCSGNNRNNNSEEGIFPASTLKCGLQPATSSENSDEWIDISESDAENGEKQQFIVVRERQKMHRSPDWSKRVRDKRLQNETNNETCIEDDSDHYYETLSPLGGKRHPTQQDIQLPQTSNASTGNVDNEHPRSCRAEIALQRSAKKSLDYAQRLGFGTVSDDYDSFDSSTDDVFKDVQNGLGKDYHDSGVDIRTIKLPEPPASTNQVYAMVKKLKKFISNKKSPNAGSSPKSSTGSQQKLYENSSQFYVEENIYRNSPNPKQLPKLTTKKAPAMPPSSQEDYENSEFHTSTSALLLTTQDCGNTSITSLSNSEKTLSGTPIYQSPNPKQQSTETPTRSKSKSGKSLRSRIQKSLAGSSPSGSENKSASSTTSKRSTFYIEEPIVGGGCGELDSGFSEKASSCDFPGPTPETQKFSTVARKAKKEAKSAHRRRTIIGLRPNDPPPPPPDDAASERMKIESSKTSWYAECGVFKNGNTLETDAQDDASLNTSKNTIYNQNLAATVATQSNSWYTEAGLYQTSGVSVASSSGSSGVSTGNEAGLGDEMAHSFFMNEPLYQIYNAAKLESISRDIEDNDSSTDGYEEIGQNANIKERSEQRDDDRQRRPRLSALQLVGPKVGPARTLWSELPEVINCLVLHTLTPRERALQEAKFEILTSEASYLKSLSLLRSHFMNHPVFRDTNVVSSRDRKALFANIVPVHECSERLLTEMESCWQDNIMLLGLSKRIYSIAEKYFRVYIDFCEHQGRMDRTLRRLKDAKGIFSQNLDLLESSPACCALNLHSFLMLPMQRITRLPLLIDAVFSKVNFNDDEYESWKMTLAIMNKIVSQCNEAANRCEQAYEIERIARQLEFPSTIRALAIAPVGIPAAGSKPRFLVKKGELTHLICRGDEAKLTFGRKITKTAIYAFLFSDLLVLAKRKSEEQFTVFDYCPRNMLTISSGNVLPQQLPTPGLISMGKNLILMTLLENYEQKTVELVLSCPSVSEQQRWLQTMRPLESETPGEKLYEQWDCPQVITKHQYEASEPDALSLDIGDVVNVMRKLRDGWYQGERLRDGAIGWFPGSYTEEVNSAHVRARNLKQRHRLLTFTATYLELKKQK